MSPGTSINDWPHHRRRDSGGVIWPSVIAILFATLSMISFAVDQSVTISPLSEPASEESR